MGYMSGIEVLNDLSEPITDIEVISVVSYKSAGGWNFLSYAFNWREVDTMATSNFAGNWIHREVIEDFGKLQKVNFCSAM